MFTSYAVRACLALFLGSAAADCFANKQQFPLILQETSGSDFVRFKSVTGDGTNVYVGGGSSGKSGLFHNGVDSSRPIVAQIKLADNSYGWIKQF